MWLMTKYGFYSVVEKRPGVFHVRARECGDLYALTAEDGPLPGERVHVSNTADYPYRLIVGREEVKRLALWLVDNLDYPNFKAEIDRQPAQRGKPYHRIHGILLDALGGYGRTAVSSGATHGVGVSPDSACRAERDLFF